MASVAGILLVFVAALLLRIDRGSWPHWWTFGVIPLLLTGLGGLLRFESIVKRYWHHDAPSWAHRIVRMTETATPFGPRFSVSRSPYSGDPYSYLLCAREDRGFYDAHVREPVFPFVVRAFLHLTGDQEIAVSFASAFFSTLTIAAIYALGAILSPHVGCLSAFFWAFEVQVADFSSEGWRDDTFTFFVVAFCFFLLRLWARPGRGVAVASGVVAALACLTRLSALSFVLPGLAVIVFGRGALAR
jgi:4-amino-4-deoxy-L-arabinose transferase-like glycosyltransferase